MMKQVQPKNRVLCLQLPNWPIQRLRQASPELRRRDVVLYEQYRTGCYRVVACSGKHGIVPGMSLAEAKALAAVHSAEHDPNADAETLSKLAGWCEAFSPIVGIVSPDNLCLNTTGLASLFGGEESLVQQVIHAFKKRGLRIRAAMADTLGAALAVANFGEEVPAVIPFGKTERALAELPVAALRITNDSTEIFHELGVERIGQLLKIRRDALHTRFGPELLRRLDQAMGLVPETIVSHRPPPDIVIGTQLEYPLTDSFSVETILNQLMERVAKALTERQQGAIRIECELQCEDVEPVGFQIGLYEASAQARHLLDLARLQLERLQLLAPVIGLKLSVLTSVPLHPCQQELFDASRAEDRRQVGLFVDRLSNRLGRTAVVRALPQSEAQPELAFRYEPLAGVRPRKRKDQRWKPLPRPTVLENEPLPLRVISVVPDGPPVQFEFRGRHRIAHAWGPERIQTGWWRGRYVERDYYRVETTDGKRFWLFRRLYDAKWFLHGVFD